MTDVRSLALTTEGIIKQVQATDDQIVAGTLKTLSGDLILNPVGDVELAANKSITTVAGTGGLDFSASTGDFKSSSGAITISGSTAVLDATGTVTIGENAASISIGATGITTTIEGDLSVQGTETVIGTTTFQDSATFEGDTTFGTDGGIDGPDSVTFIATVDSNVLFGGSTTTSGTATAGGASTLTDSGATWVVDAYAGNVVQITSGTGVGQSRLITSNTGTVLTVGTAWATAPDNTSAYAILTKTYRVRNVADPALPWDIATKNYVDSASGAANLQTAYVNGNTITTSAGEGNVTIAGDQNLLFTSSGQLGVGTSSPNEKLTVSGVVSVGEGVAPSGTAAFGKLWASSAADARPFWSDDTGQAYNLTLDRFNTLTAGATVTVDTSPALPQFNTVTLDQNTTFAATNLGNGRAASVRVVCDGTTRTLTFPAGWTWLGASVPPASLNANDVGYLSIVAFGATDNDVVAAWSYEGQPTAVSGSGVNNQIAVWSGTYTQDGSAALTFDGSLLTVTGDITQTLGAVSLTGNAASSFATTTGDLTLDAQSGSAILDGGEAAADAVRIVASNLSGGIDVDAGSGGITVDTTGALSLDAAAASNLTVTSADLTLATVTSGTLTIDGVGLVDFNAGANLDVDVTGTLDILSSSTFSIDGTGNSNVSATSGNLVLSTITSGTLELTSVALVDLNAGANLDVDVTGTVDVLATSTFSIDGTGASNVSATSGDLTLSTITSGDLVLNAVGDINADAVNVLVDASAGVSIDAAAASNLSTTAANLTISTITSGTLELTSAALVDLNAGANLDVDVTGTMDFLSTGAFSVDGTGASNVSATSGNLTISTITSGDVLVGSAANIEINAAAAGEVVVNQSGADVDFRVEGVSAPNAFVVQGSDGFVGIGTASPTAMLSVAEKLHVDSNGRITKYDNALPADGELLIGNGTLGSEKFVKATLTPGAGISVTNAAGSITLAATGTVTLTTGVLAAGKVVAASSSSALTVVAADADLSQNSARVLGVVSGTDLVAVYGLVSAEFASGLTLSLGQPAYLSQTAGVLTNVAPSAGAISEVGIIVDTSDYAGSSKCKIVLQVKAPIYL